MKSMSDKGDVTEGRVSCEYDTVCPPAEGSFTSVSGGGATAATPQASGKGDPIMTGFDGRTFEFIGQPDTFYNLISERHHQVCA